MVGAGLKYDIIHSECKSLELYSKEFPAWGKLYRTINLTCVCKSNSKASGLNQVTTGIGSDIPEIGCPLCLY